jgi:exodeoxyribonuclease-5
MSDIILTKQQKEASNKIKEWFNSNKKISQIFTLAGYAGTGKTTLINYLVRNILDIDFDDIAFVAPTGKASSELTKKGLRAMTVHKLIYVVEEIESPEVDEDGNIIYDDNNKIVKTKELRFRKRDKLEYDYSLIIIDEVSMVDHNMLRDISSFNIPILAVGDSGQLPPINKSHSLLDNPDYNLTEVVRQALDNPIISIATKIRKGEYISTGNYGDVVVARRKNLSESFIDGLLMSVDQVLCGTNKTKNEINKRVRELKGIDVNKNKLPIKGDKVICLLNNWDISFGKNDDYNLVNGMIGFVDDINYTPSDYIDVFSMKFIPDFAKDIIIEDLIVDSGLFKNNNPSYKLRQRIYKSENGRLSLKNFNINPKRKKDETKKDYNKRILNELLNRHAKDEIQINRFDYAYAITTHKFQGSEADFVLVFNESWIMRNREDKKRWLYTSITRAREKVIILI